MPKMLKKQKKISKRWNFVEILYFKYLNFVLKQNRTFAEFFDKILDPYKKTTQKFYNFFENHRQVKQKKKRCQIY